MVIVPASVFELIPTHPDRQTNYMRAQLAELEHQLQSGGAQERSTVTDVVTRAQVPAKLPRSGTDR